MLMSKSFFHTISDNQWDIIEPHLPKVKTTGRPGLNPRTVFDAIFWVLDSGAKWRYIPQEFGNWNSIYHKFRQWCDSGVFEKILQSLVDNCRKYYLVEMDSTFCKVHQHATVQENFSEIKILELRGAAKLPKFTLLSTNTFSSSLST